MAHWIVAVGFNGSLQPRRRLVMAAEEVLCYADKHQPIEGLCITRTEPERLLDVCLGLLSAADIHFENADQRVSSGQIRIDGERPLAFGNSLFGTIGGAKDAA